MDSGKRKERLEQASALELTLKQLRQIQIEVEVTYGFSSDRWQSLENERLELIEQLSLIYYNEIHQTAVGETYDRLTELGYKV